MNARPSKILFGLLALLAVVDLRADPLSQLTWRYPYPQGLTLGGVTYGGGQFVAVGDQGTILTSPDGSNWTLRTQGVFPFLHAVAYVAGKYAAVGDGGTVVISSNAVTWAELPAVTSYALYGIAGDSNWSADGAPQFMAAGAYGAAVAGLGSGAWVNQTTGNANNLWGVLCVSGGTYFCVGDSGTILEYNQSWTTRKNAGTTNYLQTAIYANNSYFYGGYYEPSPYYGSATILDSPTFSRYSTANVSGGGGASFTGLAFGGGVYAGVGYDKFALEFDNPGLTMTSTDGVNWAALPEATSENSLYGVTYGNGTFVAVGDGGAILASANGTSWTEITGHHRSAFTSMASAGNLCVASAFPTEFDEFNDLTVLVSTNGLSWAVASTNLPAMVDMASDGTNIVGMDQYTIYTTTDGYHWQGTNVPADAAYGVCHANGKFVVVCANGGIYTSGDATNWSNDSLTTTGSLYSVAYGNGRFVAAGTVAATSSDGISWSLCLSNPPAVISRIRFGKGLFVAAATVGGEILTSKDGNSWQASSVSSGNLICGLAYNGGTFLATTTGYGEMFKSSDGTNWVATGSYVPLVDDGEFAGYYNSSFYFPALGDSGSYSTVCPYNGTFLAAGIDGVMVQSGNTWSTIQITAPQTTTNGFGFTFNQQIDVPYHIQASTNLATWTNVASGTGSGQATNFLYSAATNDPTRFFRMVSP